ncbi:CIA30 family protein [Marinobacter panjinensis]|uniref:CIA30 family protein n=1 Tax=Marinobacter panjinensis TaxID=2576384 RepID=A0A4U6R0I4_9GAMM|nr:CIA30 family protein [Marinobacter panjinensis]MCR8915661.1 CIA30 family protein [Marinobacter panjinensis]TKV66903.1 CIA30 family protein [Marinobacter panjinensis]
MQSRDISGNAKQTPTLVSFSPNPSQFIWQPLGDRVMGGQSDGTVVRSEDGVGIFHGIVRLDNGGGFASVKADLPEPFDASQYTGIELLALGDGKTYKIGLRNSTDRRSIVYQQSFTPETGKWTRIRLPFSDFVPTWRGRTVPEAEPLKTSQLASVSLFVSGRQAGEFELSMQDWTPYQ